MLYTSPIKVGVLTLMILTSVTIFPFVHVCESSFKHEAMVVECRVKNSEVYVHRLVPFLAPSSLTPPEQCSAAAFVTPTGHKAVV